MTERERGVGLASYELRVQGELGPLLLSALPHAVAARVAEHSLVLTVGAGNKDLFDIVSLMVAVGLELESVR